MRKNLLLIGMGLLLAVLTTAAVACGDDDDNGDVADGGDGNGDGTVLRLSVVLSEVDGSDVIGTADLSVNGEGILVSVDMEELPEGAHANHLHTGSCDAPGGIVVTLDQIVAGTDGVGRQTTGNNEYPLSQYETGHLFAVHAGETDDPGAIISCGEVVGG